MPLCHLENSCSTQTACSAGLVSIGNLLTFVQLYIIDNGKMLPSEGSAGCLLRIICAPLFPSPPALTPRGAPYSFLHPTWSQVAQGIPNSIMGGAAISLGRCWESGYLSRDAQINWLKHRLLGPSQRLSGIWFWSKLNKNNKITHVKIFHGLGTALT